MAFQYHFHKHLADMINKNETMHQREMESLRSKQNTRRTEETTETLIMSLRCLTSSESEVASWECSIYGKESNLRWEERKGVFFFFLWEDRSDNWRTRWIVKTRTIDRYCGLARLVWFLGGRSDRRLRRRIRSRRRRRRAFSEQRAAMKRNGTSSLKRSSQHCSELSLCLSVSAMQTKNWHRVIRKSIEKN